MTDLGKQIKEIIKRLDQQGSNKQVIKVINKKETK
jgi:hypothetical protein